MGRRFKRVSFAWEGPSPGDVDAGACIAGFAPLAARLAAGLRDHLFRPEPEFTALAIRLKTGPAAPPRIVRPGQPGRGPEMIVELSLRPETLAGLPSSAETLGAGSIAALSAALSRLAASADFAAALPPEFHRAFLPRLIDQHRADGHTWAWVQGGTRLDPARMRARFEIRASGVETTVALAVLHRRQRLGAEEVWRVPGARLDEAAGWREIRRIGTRLVLRHESRLRYPDRVMALARFPGAEAVLAEAEAAEADSAARGGARPPGEG